MFKAAEDTNLLKERIFGRALTQKPGRPLLPTGARPCGTGEYLCSRINKIPSKKCWWYGEGKKQTCCHLLVKCEAWALQPRAMWVNVSGARGEAPKSPSSKDALRGRGGYPAFLTFL